MFCCGTDEPTHDSLFRKINALLDVKPPEWDGVLELILIPKIRRLLDTIWDRSTSVTRRETTPNGIAFWNQF